MSSNFTVTRICEYCGNPFAAKTTVTRFCSHICNSRHGKKRVRELKMNASDKEVKETIVSKNANVSILEFLTVKQAAKLLNVCVRTIYNLIERGQLRTAKIGLRKSIIRRSDVDKLFELTPVLPVKKLVPEKKPHARHCYSMGEMQQKFNISEKALYDLIKRKSINKFQKGKYMYVLKADVEPILKSRN